MLKVVKSVSNWMDLGLALGVNYHTLADIRNEQREKILECKMEMLSTWLQQKNCIPVAKVPSWLVLRAALLDIGESRLANEISQSHPEIVSCKYFTWLCVVKNLSMYRRRKRKGR